MKETGALRPWTLLLVSIVLQGSLAGHLQVRGYLPDLILTAVLCLGLIVGPIQGTTLGFVGGVMQGMLVGDSPGSFMVSRAVAALLLGLVSGRLFRENWLVPITLLFLGTMVGELVFFLMTPTYGFTYFLRLALAEGAWNSAVGVVIYPLALRWMTR